MDDIYDNQELRSLRGGGWVTTPIYCVSSFRHRILRTNATANNGLRIITKNMSNLANTLGIEMVKVPPGTFMFGEYREYEVTLESFYIGRYAITQEQWRRVANLPRVGMDLKEDPSFFKGHNRPVESVDWDDAVEFCKRVSAHTGDTYTLPSETQWEYACRGGTDTKYYFGDNTDPELLNCFHTKLKKTTPVGTFPPNPFGLYDMHGNVWEWCADEWEHDVTKLPEDGKPYTKATSSYHHPIKGGSWGTHDYYCGAARRARLGATNKLSYLGLRIAKWI